MKKCLASILLIIPLTVFAEDFALNVPEWKDFAPKAFVDVKEPKGIGKLNVTAKYWYDRKVAFDEGIENCTIYNDDTFSCEVKLKKNMKLYTGVSKIDELHDDLFFVYYENGYKLVDMQSRAE